jgi:putative transposase
MPNTYTSLNYHIVFPTRGREHWLEKTRRDQLWAYMGGTVRGLKGVALAVNGWNDHVHLLVGLRPDHRVSDVLRELKKASTEHVQREYRKAGFSWQDGYYAVTISSGDLDDKRRYIEGQEEHHGSPNAPGFLDELKAILKENKVDFDPKYLE